MSKNIRISWIPLLCILMLAAFMRLYRLTEVPPGVNRDEASIGYTAYSLIKTGKDEYGRVFPLSFESFGDWKLPLYIYTTVPFVKIFGLNELAVRLPSAIAGILSVFFTYFLVRSLFKDSLTSDIIPLVTSLFLALSPWSVHFSRTGSEANLAAFFVMISVLLWLKAVRGKPVYFIFSYPLLALTYWTYAGNHIFSTLLFLGLIVLSWKDFHKNIFAWFGVIIFSILLIIISAQTLLSADKTKISGISIFGDPAIIHTSIELPRLQHPDLSNLFVRLAHNRITFAGETFFQNYLKSFSPEFLFIRGGTNHAHNIANFGNLYLAESPIFYLGILYLLIKRKQLSSKLLLWWLLISPIAASITKDAPHSARMFAIYPLPPILSALGLAWITEEVKNRKVLIIGCVLFGFLYLANVSLYIDRYFFHFPLNEAANWGIGYKNLTQVLNLPQYKNKIVVMTRPESSPYIYLLFYSAYDPRLYQGQALRYPPTSDGFVHVSGFGRYQFRAIDWKKDIYLPSTVLIDFIDEHNSYVYPNAYVINQSNGKPYIQLVGTDY